MAASPHVVDVDARSFSEQVIDESRRRPVVVDFWAPWCGPCRALGPVLESAADEDGGAWLLAKLNTDENQALAQQYGIRGIPAVKAFVDGRVVDEFTGALPKPHVRRFLDGIVPSPADDEAQAGRRALDGGDTATARARFGAALELKPAHVAARLGLAAVALREGDAAGARRELEEIPAHRREELGPAYAELEMAVSAAEAGDPSELRARVEQDANDHEARLALGRVYAASGDWEGAFGSWLELVKRDRGPWREAGRKAMVEAFTALGRNEMTDRWRSKLAMTLF